MFLSEGKEGRAINFEMEGAFTTEELLGWFNGVMPPSRVKKNAVKMEMPVTNDSMVNGNHLSGEADWRGEVAVEIVEGASSEPCYNLDPDDGVAFQFDDNFGPGNPTNPSARPGDHDYGVDQNSKAIFEDFSFEEDNNPILPVHDHHDEILHTIRDNEVRTCCTT